MKSVFIYLISLFLLSGCNSMAYSNDTILELKATAGLKVTVIDEGGVRYLQVSGVPTYSSLHGVKEVDQMVEKGSISIIVKLTTTKEVSLEFGYKVKLDESVDSVTFGAEKVLLWSRDKGVDQEVVAKYTGSVI